MPLLEPAEKKEEELWEVLGQVRQQGKGAVVESIPWITLKHPRHPVQQELLEGIRPTFTAVPGGMRRWLRFARCWAGAVRLTFQLIHLRLLCGSILRKIRRQRFDVAAKSWVFGKDPTPGGDFYYGDLGSRLSRYGFRLLLLTSDPRGVNRPVCSFFNERTGQGQIPEWSLVPWTAPVKTAWEQWEVFGRLLSWGRSLPEGLLRRAALQAGWDALSPGVTSKALYAWVGREAARLWDLRAIITLYEGHGWERCFLQGASQENPRCRTVGYQHTILMPYQMELLRPLPKGVPPRPQTVLCLGERPKELLRAGHPSSDLRVFGSFRNPVAGPCAEGPADDAQAVLVLSEGFPEEAVRLFNCALESAALSPERRFVLRSHPILPFEDVRGHLTLDPAGLPNVEISAVRSIEEDFARSSAVLYRGSSSVLYAVLRGLKPLYLEGGPCNDPLFEMGSWRTRVDSARQVIRALEAHSETAPPNRLAGWKEAAEYVRRYACSVREELLEELCQKV